MVDFFTGSDQEIPAMCGIAGAVAIEGTLDPSIRRAVGAMTDAMWHRGPDAGGVHDHERGVLGHRRLAIIDLTGGEQPMCNEDGSVWVVFNGEIYNHHALRRELEAHGHTFRTRSDTEAIVHGFEEWGVGCAARCEGMFAFAVFDRRSGSLYLARDRLGKKPLFWMTSGGALHFASEMKALQQSPAWDDTIDHSVLEEYLALGYILAPRTIYRSVKKLEPAHWLLLQSGRIETRAYWDLEVFDDDRRRDAERDAALEETLRGAVEERLESEVPLGAFLSGGIDSGLVVAFMKKAMTKSLVTTTTGFSDAAHNELDAAALTARHFATEHHAEVVEPRLEDLFEKVVTAFDEPFADSSAIPTWYVSKMARRHVTVALSGDGGDESFGGYDFRYVPHRIEETVRRLVPGRFLWRRAAAHLAPAWPRGTWVPGPLRLSTILENLSVDAVDAYFADLCFMHPARVRRLLGRAPAANLRAYDFYEAVTGPYRRCPSRDPIQRAEYADVKVYLPNDVLVKVDRMSMQHSLEVRCPLLDRRVVEAAFRIPAEAKVRGRESKAPLRALARKHLPRELATLPKHGFTAPVGRWLADTAAGRFRDEVFGADSGVRGMLDMEQVRSLFDAHRAGRMDHAYELWAIWFLDQWARQRRARTGARAAA
jgi:asparagine synthase (glutamine-hydrolysing)